MEELGFELVFVVAVPVQVVEMDQIRVTTPIDMDDPTNVHLLAMVETIGVDLDFAMQLDEVLEIHATTFEIGAVTSHVLATNVMPNLAWVNKIVDEVAVETMQTSVSLPSPQTQAVEPLHVTMLVTTMLVETRILFVRY